MKNMQAQTVILTEQNREESESVFKRVVQAGIEFKLGRNVRASGETLGDPKELMRAALPESGKPIETVLEEFIQDVLPHCYNFASPQFMGFPDAGNSVAALAGAILSEFLQQNLINQSFCSPSGTFVEIAVINWLRQVVGYDAVNPDDIFGVGGIITSGGTASNAIAMMLARENLRASMKDGVDGDYYLVVPEGIGHYSVKSAQMWIGCGNKLLEVPIKGYRYDLQALEETLTRYRGRVMAVVAYAGDSRTMTVDNLEDIVALRNRIDPSVWLHADAAHGFSLGFSKELSKKIKGIELFDSITTDPHKVMNVPYTISGLLVRDPSRLRAIASESDLIMKERYAFGQITPFIGSKPWSSLKLWFAMKTIGIQGYGEIIEHRHALALTLQDMIDESEDFTMINRVAINSVAFMYHPKELGNNVEALNTLNQALHEKMLVDGTYHLHQFSITDDGAVEKGAVIYPLRYMNGNPATTESDLRNLLEYIRRIGGELNVKPN